jgi:hypothetical protein
VSQVEELESDELTGRVIGHYEILNMVGRGGMGMVFRAKHVNLKRIVALKILPPSMMKGEKGVQRFQREVELLARLSHPNIAMAYDSGVCEGMHYLVMEFVDGLSLKQHVQRRGPLPVEEALKYVRQVAEGLAYAHREEIIHRDIKPSNLMVTEQRAVKILDLGVARMAYSLNRELNAESSTVKDLTSQVTFVGTAEYTSPEQAKDSKMVSNRSDLYSLGCTLHYLLTGKTVFQGESTMEYLLNHQTMPRPSLLDYKLGIPASVDQLFQKMIAISPENRYSSMEQFVQALDELSLEPPPAASAPRTRLMAGAITLGVAVAVGMVGLAAIWNRNDSPVPIAAPAPSPGGLVREIPPVPQKTGLDLLQEWTVDFDKHLWVNLALPTRDGLRVVIAGGRFDDRPGAHFPVTVRRLADGAFEEELDAPASWTWCGAESPDGSRLLVGTGGSPEEIDDRPIGGSDFAIYVWNVSDPGQPPLRIAGHQQAVTGAGFLPGDRIVSGSFDTTLRMFDSVNGRELRQFDNTFGDVQSLAVSPTGRQFATGHFERVAVWDPEQSAPLVSFPVHLGKAMAFSDDGTQLAVGGLGRTIDVWDLRQERITKRFEHEEDRVNCLAWCDAGRFLLAGHNDGMLTRWEFDSNRRLKRETIRDAPIKTLAICSDQCRAITGSSDGVVRIWNLTTEGQLH